MNQPRIAFAGDRDIAVKVLQYLLRMDVYPLALLVPDPKKASHANELIKLSPFLGEEYILSGCQFREERGISLLKGLALDYIIGIHFPYIISESVLSIPRIGFLNLHPAYLPFNRGWHTPSWAILEGTLIGATLHFMDTGIDTGDIIHQKQLDVSPGDTAHTLYQRLKELELEVFKEAFPHLLSNSFQRHPQLPEQGTAHNRKDLFNDSIQKLDLEHEISVRETLKRLRALTTNRLEEAAYYEVNGRRYRVQVFIQEEPKEYPA